MIASPARSRCGRVHKRSGYPCGKAETCSIDLRDVGFLLQVNGWARRGAPRSERWPSSRSGGVHGGRGPHGTTVQRKTVQGHGSAGSATVGM